MNQSIILSTYNQPAWLEKVVWGYSAQTYRSFELVIADDGSTSETASLIKRLAKETGLRIQHVWHEDNGFRKCRILNKAILAARAEYLVFSDGDCIPRKDFLATHARFARQGRFLSGGMVRLPMALSHQITIHDIIHQRATDISWLRRHGMSSGVKPTLLLESPRLGAIYDRLTTTKATWNGHNASGWKDDLLRVNGFDERMGYGGEDRELGERLVNIGVRPYQIRHRAVCVHLEHARGYVDEETLRWNRNHRREIRGQGVKWTEFGAIQIADRDQDDMIIALPGVDQAPQRRAA